MNIIKAPFTEEQVENLNKYQKEGQFHPFTCLNHRDESHIEFEKNHGKNYLIATKDGWICPVCDYKQDWAHSFMCEYHDGK